MQGETALLTFPRDHDLSSSDALMPLWYYNERKGYWQKEGEVEAQGITYIGTVTHFTAWGIATKGEKATLELCVEDKEGEKISNAKVALTSTHWISPEKETNTTGSLTFINLLANEKLTITASKTSYDGNSSILKEGRQTITVVEEDKKVLDGCIVLKENNKTKRNRKCTSSKCSSSKCTSSKCSASTTSKSSCPNATTSGSKCPSNCTSSKCPASTASKSSCPNATTSGSKCSSSCSSSKCPASTTSKPSCPNATASGSKCPSTSCPNK
jgi:hypothetical protein